MYISYHSIFRSAGNVNQQIEMCGLVFIAAIPIHPIQVESFLLGFRPESQ